MIYPYMCLHLLEMKERYYFFYLANYAQIKTVVTIDCCTNIFKELQSMIQTSERIGVNGLKEKWSNLSKMWSESHVIKKSYRS